MIAEALVVSRKEFRDALRDRRTLAAAFAYSALGPLVLILLLAFVAKSEDEVADLVVAVSGSERAPALLPHLGNEGLEVLERARSAEPIENVPSGADALLEIADSFAADFADSEPATVRLYADWGKTRQAVAAGRVQRALESFRNSVLTARLVARGVEPSVVRPLAVSVFDLSANTRQGRAFGGMLLLFFVLAPFFSGMSVAIDTTAGERERSTLASLLAQPVAAWSLGLGKWAVVMLFGLAGTCLTVTLGFLALGWAPLGALGIRVHLDRMTMAGMALALFPLSLSVSALQMWIAMKARSFKEGQTTMTLLSFVPAVLGFVHSFSGGTQAGIVPWLPLFLELRLLEGLLFGGTIDWTGWVAALSLSAALAFACLVGSARQFESEAVTV